MIVNTANDYLKPAGSGVCGAIHKAAGHGFGCRVIVHVVGPKIENCEINRESPCFLEFAYIASLMVAKNHDPRIRGIAFSCISVDSFGYPIDQAARAAILLLIQGLLMK